MLRCSCHVEVQCRQERGIIYINGKSFSLNENCLLIVRLDENCLMVV